MISVNVNKDFSGSGDHKLYISLNFASCFLLQVNPIDISTKYVPGN